MSALAEPRTISTRLSPFEALERLREELGDEALRRALAGGPDVSSFHRRVIRRILRREPALALLAGTVDDLASHRLTWPATASGTRAGFRLAGAASLQIEGDRDGSVLDGAIIYDPSKEVLLRIALKAEGGGSRSRRRRQDDTSMRGAASASGAVEISNWFRHSIGDWALGALHRSVGEMVLPGEIGLRPLRREGGVPMQFVHVGWTGSVRVGGTVQVSRTLFSAGTASALGVTAPWVASGAEASIAWTGSIEGTFDLLIFPIDGSRVAVRLAKSSLSRRSSSVALVAEVAIEAPAAVAERVAGLLFEPLEPLLRVLERERRRFADLRALIREELTDDVEDLLRSETITKQLREWLKKIGIDADLRRRLREVLLDVFDEATARAVDEIQHDLEPVLVAARELVRRVTAVRRTLDRAIEESLRVKVALELARRRRAMEETAVLLECRIDPVADRETFEALVRGDWRPAIEAHRAGAALELTGAFSRERLLRIESELAVEIAGKELGIGSLLRQEWEQEVTADGDLRLKARSGVEVWSRGWRSLRTIEALASTEILETLAAERSAKQEFRIEWSEELEPSLARLLTLEQRLVGAGILAAATGLERDLALEGERHSARPFGRLAVTARLRLDGEDLDRVAAASPRRARETFARMLAEEYAGASLLARSDASGLPLFAWPDVLKSVERSAINEKLARVRFASADGRGVGVRRELVPILTLLARQVLLFSKLHREMRQVAAAAGKEDAAETVRRAQERMIGAMRPLLTSTTLRRGDLGMAVFRTLMTLAAEDGSDPRVDVVILREDGTRFVY